jgi:hypothetical protein
MNHLIPVLIVLIPAIAVMDYALFYNHIPCENCGAGLPWNTFMLATTRQVLLFIAGYAYAMGGGAL